LLKKISFTTADVALEPGFPWQPATASNPYINRSDLLAILYDKVGLQIISDHYSQWSPMNAAKDVAVSQVLENFLKGRYPPAKWGWDGKFLFMRSPNFRALDAVEVPDRLLRAWKSVVEKQGYLGLEELCQISLLAEQQINSLRTSERYLGLKVNTHSSLTQPILRLYGLLTPRQKREAFSGGTPATAFTPEQQVVLSTILKPDKSDLPVEADLMVGVYKDGVRIDKTESRPAVAQAVATEFEVKERETRSQTSYQASSEGAVTTHISAPTLQEAQQFAAAHGLASSIVQVRVKEIPYQLTLWMSDGTHKESNVSVIPPPERVEPKPK
jgi:hypothetical protein